AAATGHAARQGVARLGEVRRHARTRAEVVRAVEVDPCVHAAEVGEEARAIDGEVADERELLHRPQLDRLLELVDQRRAGLTDAPIDDHGARAAHLLEAGRVPHHGRGLLSVAGDGPTLDGHERGVDVEVLLPRDLELLPARWLVLAALALDLQHHRAWLV